VYVQKITRGRGGTCPQAGGEPSHTFISSKRILCSTYSNFQISLQKPPTVHVYYKLPRKLSKGSTGLFGVNKRTRFLRISFAADKERTGRPLLCKVEIASGSFRFFGTRLTKDGVLLLKCQVVCGDTRTHYFGEPARWVAPCRGRFFYAQKTRVFLLEKRSM
jgi:hypothetical protein